MNFIHKIFENKIDEIVRDQFVRFGKGLFENRSIISIKNSTKLKIQTSFEFSSDFIELIVNNTNETLDVKGRIFCKEKTDFPEKFQNISKKKGFFIAEINDKLTTEELKDIYEKFKLNSYLLLNINGKEVSLKVSQTLYNPRSSKFDGKFCNATFTGKLKDLILSDFAFDVDKNFKILNIKHTFEVKDVEVTEDMKDDYERIRKEAKRIVSMTRFLQIDNANKEVKLDFKA